MNCLICHRELKNPTASGMGKVCASKNHSFGEIAPKSVRVEILYQTAGRRSYLVFTDPKRRVVVTQTADGKIAKCDCGSAVRCQHIDRIAVIEMEKF